MTRLAPLALTLLVAGCIESAPPPGSGRVDSESHWLAPCADDAECGGLACLCGVCTRACDAAAPCGGEARCVDFGGAVCAPVPACAAGCEGDGDCPDALRCIGGACQPAYACLFDGDCPFRNGPQARCRDGRCRSLEICAADDDGPDGVDQDGDGAIDCADPDCVDVRACRDVLPSFAEDPTLAACAAGRALPELDDPAAALAASADLDATARADLAHLRDTLAATEAPSPSIAAVYADAVAALDAALAALATRVEDCQPPACDPTALLAAELVLIDDAADALGRFAPDPTRSLPLIDCVSATARIRFARAGWRWALLCPDRFDAAAHAARLDGWLGWSHAPRLRAEDRCALRAAYDACVPAALDTEPIGPEPICAEL